MSLWMVAYWRLNGIGGEFYEPSIVGVHAFALYFDGRYGDAARAYRQAHRGHVWVDEAEDPTGAFAVAVGDSATGEQRARATLATAPSAIEPRVTLRAGSRSPSSLAPTRARAPGFSRRPRAAGWRARRPLVGRPPSVGSRPLGPPVLPSQDSPSVSSSIGEQISER